MTGRIGFGLGLAVIWVLAWGSLTPANVLGGLAVAVLLLVVAPDTWPAKGPLTIRPLAMLRFFAYATVEVLKSNLAIAREVLTRRPRLQTGVVAVSLPPCSDELLTIMSNVMCLSPGLMIIEVERDPTVLYVHVLHRDGIEVSRGQIIDLARLAYRAFGTDEAIAALEAGEAPA